MPYNIYCWDTGNYIYFLRLHIFKLVKSWNLDTANPRPRNPFHMLALNLILLKYPLLHITITTPWISHKEAREVHCLLQPEATRTSSLNCLYPRVALWPNVEVTLVEGIHTISKIYQYLRRKKIQHFKYAYNIAHTHKIQQPSNTDNSVRSFDISFASAIIITMQEWEWYRRVFQKLYRKMELKKFLVQKNVLHIFILLIWR